MWQTGALAHRGFSLAVIQPLEPLKWQEPANSAVPDPCALPVSKTLEPVCPVPDTQGAGDFGELVSSELNVEDSRAVVLYFYKNIVVA
jgi:hypothetical protein